MTKIFCIFLLGGLRLSILQWKCCKGSSCEKFLRSNTSPPKLKPYLLPSGNGKKIACCHFFFLHIFSQLVAKNFFLTYCHLVYKSMQELNKGGGGECLAPT